MILTLQQQLASKQTALTDMLSAITLLRLLLTVVIDHRLFSWGSSLNFYFYFIIIWFIHIHRIKSGVFVA